MYVIGFHADPCQSQPCQGPNTYCQQLSADDFDCLCTGSLYPTNGNAEEYGCDNIGKYMRKVNKQINL